MGRAGIHLAGCMIGVALLAGASGAVAAADTGDSGVGETANSSDSQSGADQSADPTGASTYGSGENADTAGDRAGDPSQNNTGGAEESGVEQGSGKKPVDDSDANDDPGDKTISRVPTLLPEAPPPIDLAPLPEELPPLPLEPVPPPVDLPPAIPSAPAEPDAVDVTSVGSSAGLAYGGEPPVLTVPVIVAPLPGPLGHLLGASIAPRMTFGGPEVTPTSRWGVEPAQSIRQPVTTEPLLREPPPTNVGLTARGLPSNRTSYNNDNLRHSRLSSMAAGALPGLAGVAIMTATGICLGYRQAMAAQQLRYLGTDRFLA
jgi:hypothetical protein